MIMDTTPILPSPLRSVTPVIDVYIKLAQYPILAQSIRERMRQELFRRGIIDEAAFETEVTAKAIESQRREGLHDPFNNEQAQTWQKRKGRIRDFQTDAAFANNLPLALLEQIIEEVRQAQPGQTHSLELTFNPEIAPWEMLFQQGELYESLPEAEQAKVMHHLQEIKVVLIKGMISDQLRFIAIAKHVFSISDLRRVYERRIGGGKIGGKSAGMMLAWKMLQLPASDGRGQIAQHISIPDSFFIGSELIYDFRLMNDLENTMNQKYKPLEEIREQYPAIVEGHLNGRFSADIIAQLQKVLQEMGDDPIIVRSSSLLEDNFGFAFAGKYHSYFCPNQGSHEENLEELMNAIKRVYASTVNPDAILYRQRHGLIDYDERMGILIQRVRGQRHGRYYFPALAGVGFSHNPFRWNAKIRREDGFLRIVWGIGTRAVDRVDNDYPRMISLSHPRLRPETSASAIRQYSQWFIDVVDLQDNSFKTVPISEVLGHTYPELRYIASLDRGDYLQKIVSSGSLKADDRYVLTFDYLVHDKQFVDLMHTALTRLEKGYKTAVDIEFAIDIIPTYPYPEYKLHLLQCRPLSRREEESVQMPSNILPEDTLFTSRGLIPDGKAEHVRYVIFVDPERYGQIPELTIKRELGRVIGRLNKLLENDKFILLGPGRWGSANIDLGVQVSYADIFNTKVLIEMAVAKEGKPPELSYGTHFFQDLVEAKIYSLPLHLHMEGSYFDWAFFRQSPNCLADLLPQDGYLADWVQVIDVMAASHGRVLNIFMDGQKDEAIGFLAPAPERAQLHKGQNSVGLPG